MKLWTCLTPLLLLLVLTFTAIPSARAQSNFSVYFGAGTARDKASGQSFDFFGTGTPVAAPAMGGAFGILGADFMLRHHLGFGAAYSFRFAQTPYSELSYRPTFFNFNAIYQPSFHHSRIVPEIQGGLGGANIKFYISQQSCLVSCQTYNSFLQSSNHFELHASGGVRFYVKPSIFIRPQVDVHWVHHFVEFGSDWVPEYTIAVGYTFGER